MCTLTLSPPAQSTLTILASGFWGCRHRISKLACAHWRGAPGDVVLTASQPAKCGSSGPPRSQVVKTGFDPGAVKVRVFSMVSMPPSLRSKK
jgi:hypothetical protein